MRFSIDDQERVDVPEALARALSVNAAADEAWRASTPGRRRGLAHLVAAAKTDRTRLKRIVEVLAALTSPR